MASLPQTPQREKQAGIPKVRDLFLRFNHQPDKVSQLLVYGVLIGISCAVLAAPIVIVLILYQSSLRFNPSLFINLYLEFLFGLVGMFVAFGLINVYWEHKLEGIHTHRQASTLRRLFDRLRETIGETERSVSRIVENDHQARTSHEIQKIRILLSRANTIAVTIDAQFQDEPAKLDPALQYASTEFRTSINPDISDVINSADDGIDIELLRRLLSKISHKIDLVTEQLRHTDSSNTSRDLD